jgi:hypothetical protein
MRRVVRVAKIYLWNHALERLHQIFVRPFDGFARRKRRCCVSDKEIAQPFADACLFDAIFDVVGDVENLFVAAS